MEWCWCSDDFGCVKFMDVVGVVVDVVVVVVWCFEALRCLVEVLGWL